jgi:integrase
MAKRKSIRVGYVTLRKTAEPGCWQLDFRDPGTHTRKRLRIRAATEKGARGQADHVSKQIAQGRGFLAAERFNPTVAAAMHEAIGTSRGNLVTRCDYTNLANGFIAWLKSERAGVKTWADVTTKIVQDYVAHGRECKPSNDQTRKRLYIVKATSRYMAATYGFQDVARPVRSDRQQENPLAQKENEARRALPVGDLAAFLEWLESKRPDLYPIACLQGLCGFRAMEAVNLREQDIDLSSGTVTVTETQWHRPKNRSSYRTIPVGPHVLSVLRDRIATLKVRREDGCLFATERGNAPWSVSGYCHAMKRELLACWKASGLESLRRFRSHWLRATFVSLVRAKRADHRLLQVYIGHSPGDTLGRHYEVIDVALLRAEIVPISEGLWHKSGTAVNGSVAK